MPRKKKAEWPKTIRPLDHLGSVPRKDPAGAVFVENNKARALVTIKPDSPVWGGDPIQTIAVLQAVAIPGALVKIEPPPTAHQDDVERVEQQLRKTAQAVRTMPSGPDQKTPVQHPSTPASPRMGPRQVVLAMAEEVPSQNREMLREICERTLVEVKL